VQKAKAPETSIRTYRSKRDFAVTPEPAPTELGAAEGPSKALFVVQKHRAHRAGLHWDFRLEHGGVLWSWAVPRGPSLDPADRRVAIHVEDHPLDYAAFQGTIPDGQYGAGTVETWDRGTWEPLGDPEEGMRKGNLRFVLAGRRLSGRFTLARLKRRDPRKQEGWFLIKGHDEAAREGMNAERIEQESQPVPVEPAPAQPVRAKRGPSRSQPPLGSQPPPEGARRGGLPDKQEPQLCAIAEDPPDGPGWVSEIKLDGYRLLASIEAGKVRLLTRNGHDWADRMPAVAAGIGKLDVAAAMLDGELVALRDDGVSSFPELQAALSEGRDERLHFYAFDLLHLNGWDLRPCRLLDRKRVLASLVGGAGMLRFSDHVEGATRPMRREACGMGLEGIICKQASSPYKGGRSGAWVKVKCQGREEFVVLGWTPPAGTRIGIGALHVGYYDPEGGLHYAGGLGTGFSDAELGHLREMLDALAAPPPAGLLVSGDPLDKTIRWVKPEIVVEVEFISWTGAGRVRHAVYQGMREDKPATEVVRDVADPGEERVAFQATKTARVVVSASRATKGWKGAVPPRRQPAAPTPAPDGAARIVVARPPKRATATVGGVELTNADRQLWPGITKRDLAEYWQAVAEFALRGIAHRPLSVVRCPDGIGGKQQFFQKNGHGLLPPQIREETVAKSPYLAIDDVDGLIALAQMSAIELHPWGASEADPLHPDRLVFDLDPGEGVAFADVVQAAREVRNRLQRLGLASFCRTTGGKGLHVVVPLVPTVGWDEAKAFCRVFAEAMAEAQPERYLAHLKIADRRGRILVDWLRNGLGATAVSSFCPRARPGATVATPLAWSEVNPKLDPQSFTLRTVPDRLARLKQDPWKGFDTAKQSIPDLTSQRSRPKLSPATGATVGPATSAATGLTIGKGRRSSIVFAPKPRPAR
jgi:bifunctional non-homologous end joining protein LigD